MTVDGGHLSLLDSRHPILCPPSMTSNAEITVETTRNPEGQSMPQQSATVTAEQTEQTGHRAGVGHPEVADPPGEVVRLLHQVVGQLREAATGLEEVAQRLQQVEGQPREVATGFHVEQRLDESAKQPGEAMEPPKPQIVKIKPLGKFHWRNLLGIYPKATQ